MEIKVIVFDGNLSRCIARETFASVKEVKDFMSVIHELDPKAKYSVTEVKK